MSRRFRFYEEFTALSGITRQTQVQKSGDALTFHSHILLADWLVDFTTRGADRQTDTLNAVHV